MNTHCIQLNSYYPTGPCNPIYLGTAGSHGNEQLKITRGKGWENLVIQVIFHPCEVAILLPPDDLLDIPWEVTAYPLSAQEGRIVFQGFNQDRLVNSVDLHYTVSAHSIAAGRHEKSYTPGIVEGVLNQMTANKSDILAAAQQTGQSKNAAAASAAEAAVSAANAQQSAGAANTSAGQAAASASQAAGSAAAAGETLTRVQTAGQEAQQKVKDAEIEALDKIAAAAPALPAVFTDTAWQSVTVKPDATEYNLTALAPIEAAIRPTVTGNPVVCINSATWGLQGMKIYGKSTQDGTPSPKSPTPIVSTGDNGNVKVTVCGSNLLDLSKGKNGTGEGVTFTKHPDGSYQMTGTATDVSGNVWFLGNYSGSEALFILAPGTYFVQDCELFFNRTYIGGSGKIVLNSFTLVGGVRNPTMVSGKEYNTTLYPAIFVGETAQPWTPYTGKNLALSTPTGLLGIPVENGGNYTDSTGQQWICDEINFSKGKKITRIQSVTITPASNLYTATGKDLLSFALKLPSFAFNTSGDTVKTKWFCDTYKISTEGLVGSSENEAAGIYNQNQMSTLFINDRRFSTVEEYKTWLTNNPVTILYALASPIESDITVEEMASYHTLKTYNDISIIDIDQIGELEVQYTANATKYLESITDRITALEAARLERNEHTTS